MLPPWFASFLLKFGRLEFLDLLIDKFIWGSLSIFIVPISNLVFSGVVNVLIAPPKLGQLTVRGDDYFGVISLVFQRGQIEPSHLLYLCLYLFEVFNCVCADGEWQSWPWLLLALGQYLSEPSGHLVACFLE